MDCCHILGAYTSISCFNLMAKNKSPNPNHLHFNLNMTTKISCEPASVIKFQQPYHFHKCETRYFKVETQNQTLMCGGQSLTTKPELGLIMPQVMAVHDELSTNWLHNQASNLLLFVFVFFGKTQH